MLASDGKTFPVMSPLLWGRIPISVSAWGGEFLSPLGNKLESIPEPNFTPLAARQLRVEKCGRASD